VAFGVCNVAGTERSVAIGQFNNASLSSIALGSANTASGYRSGSLSGCTNISANGRAVIAGGGSNSASGYHSSILGGKSNTASGSYSVTSAGRCNRSTADWSSVLGGQSNCATGCYSSNLGGCGNTASGYVSSVLGGWGNCATATYSSTIGINARAYLYGQNTLSSGQFSVNGDAQSSTLVTRKSQGSVVSDGTFVLSLDGTGTTNLIIPPTGKTWAVRIQYVARVTAISGTATGLVLGDSRTQTQEVGIKNVGGTATILSGSPNSSIALEDASMSTAQMNYAVGASQDLQMTFKGPTFAGGGNLNIKVVATLQITEVL
jgi:hypothetical protein